MLLFKNKEQRPLKLLYYCTYFRPFSRSKLLFRRLNQKLTTRHVRAASNKQRFVLVAQFASLQLVYIHPPSFEAHLTRPEGLLFLSLARGLFTEIFIRQFSIMHVLVQSLIERRRFLLLL